MGCSLPGCSVHGITQTRILEWVAFRSVQISLGKCRCSLQKESSHLSKRHMMWFLLLLSFISMLLHEPSQSLFGSI